MGDHRASGVGRVPYHHHLRMGTHRRTPTHIATCVQYNSSLYAHHICIWCTHICICACVIHCDEMRRHMRDPDPGRIIIYSKLNWNYFYVKTSSFELRKKSFVHTSSAPYRFGSWPEEHAERCCEAVRPHGYQIHIYMKPYVHSHIHTTQYRFYVYVRVECAFVMLAHAEHDSRFRVGQFMGHIIDYFQVKDTPRTASDNETHSETCTIYAHIVYTWPNRRMRLLSLLFLSFFTRFASMILGAHVSMDIWNYTALNRNNVSTMHRIINVLQGDSM